METFTRETFTRPLAVVTGASTGRGVVDRRFVRRDDEVELVPGAGFIPGTYQAVYNAKAFLDSFSFALRAELKDTGVTVTCLMPRATETEFFERADMMDTKIGQDRKADPAMVARHGFDAVMRGDVVTGWQNKLQSATPTSRPHPCWRSGTGRCRTGDRQDHEAIAACEKSPPGPSRRASVKSADALSVASSMAGNDRSRVRLPFADSRPCGIRYARTSDRAAFRSGRADARHWPTHRRRPRPPACCDQ